MARVKLLLGRIGIWGGLGSRLRSWLGGGSQFFIRNGIDAAVPVIIDTVQMVEPEEGCAILLVEFMASGSDKLTSAARRLAKEEPFCNYTLRAPPPNTLFATWGMAAAKPGEPD